MSTRRTESRRLRDYLSWIALALVLGLAAAPPARAAGIDADAEEVLRGMAKHLGSLSAFRVTVDTDNEILDTNGLKLQLSSTTSLVIERPGRIYSHRNGPVAELETFFDGKTVTVHGKKLDVYFQVAAPGTLDEAIETLRNETGLEIPAADLLYADPYPGLVDGVKSGAYMGLAWVGGVECHHLAFRAAQVDWQIWVRTGDAPLPMKYVITTKWMTGAPQYSTRFRDWDTGPKIPAGQFVYTPTASARKLEALPIDEMGELQVQEVKR